MYVQSICGFNGDRGGNYFEVAPLSRTEGEHEKAQEW